MKPHRLLALFLLLPRHLLPRLLLRGHSWDIG